MGLIKALKWRHRGALHELDETRASAMPAVLLLQPCGIWSLVGVCEFRPVAVFSQSVKSIHDSDAVLIACFISPEPFKWTATCDAWNPRPPTLRSSCTPVSLTAGIFIIFAMFHFIPPPSIWEACPHSLENNSKIVKRSVWFISKATQANLLNLTGLFLNIHTGTRTGILNPTTPPQFQRFHLFFFLLAS